MLPDQAIWDIVAYVRSLSKDTTSGWGKTTSLQAFEIEQVPAEYMKTDTPWKYTEPFSFGQKPDKKVK
jgi:cytochrome c oxidase cbb3-type subunit 3